MSMKRLWLVTVLMRYRTTRGAMFEKGERPPNRPYIRGFDK